MNSAEVQKKAKIINAFDNMLWAAMLAVVFIPVGVGIYTGVRVPNPLANAMVACAFLGPFVLIAAYIPIKFLVLRAINFRCASCSQIPAVKTVACILQYSLCLRCNRPFVTDPPQDLLSIFTLPTHRK